MRKFLRRFPWVWIVLLLALFVVMDLIFVWVAVWNRPELVG